MIAAIVWLFLIIVAILGWGYVAYHMERLLSFCGGKNRPGCCFLPGYDLCFVHYQKLDDDAKRFEESAREVLKDAKPRKILWALFFLLNFAILAIPACWTVSDHEVFFGSSLMAALVATGAVFWGVKKTAELAIDRAYLVLRQTEENRILADNALSAEEKIRAIGRKRSGWSTI